jgi:hypothetical protein
MTTTTTTNFGFPKPPLGATGTADGYNTLLDAADAAILTRLGGVNAPTPTEFTYLDATSSVQTQINSQSTAVSSPATINPGHHHVVSVIATGTADAIIGTYTPAVAALTDGMEVIAVSTAANATATPTFQYNALVAKTIVKGAATALVAGDIPEAGYACHLKYRTATDTWQLLNPAMTVKNIGTTAGTVAAGDDARFIYSMTFAAPSATYNDSTNYVWGVLGSVLSTEANSVYRSVPVPWTGTVVAACVSMNMTTGTNESSTLYLRVDNTTNYALNTVMDCSVANNYTSAITNLNIAVTAGQKINMNWLTPAWATNPTGVSISVTIYIQR